MFYYLVVYDKKFQNKTLLKKRFFKNVIYPTLKFGEFGFSFKRNTRFEYIYLFYLRRFIKKTIKTNKKFIKNTKTWIFIRPNHIMTKKSKNSRMGKGKGSFSRWCTLMEKGFIFVEFKGISFLKIKKCALKMENKVKVPIQIIVKLNK